MSTLLADLNAAVAAYEGTCGRTLKNWTLDADGYPVIEGMTTLLPVSKTKRISVIGDSISTFRGFVPSGYSCHYPTSDHDLTSVSQTYWYRLAHDLMSDARIERNISFSGTAVACTTDPAYASQAWYGNDFCARFIAQGGVGQPDIVLIHGGTNDYAHNVDPLAPGLPIQSAEAPSEAALAELFAAADAAATRAEIEALDDTTFCTAYIKLLRLLKERYPERKILPINTYAASLGEGMQVMEAARMIEEGKSLEEIEKQLLTRRPHMCQFFTVDDLVYLKRGGRISGATALIGTVLSIKPILRGDETGHIVSCGKVRGNKKAYAELADYFDKRALDKTARIGIAHADNCEGTDYLLGLLRERDFTGECLEVYYEPVTGAHVGPGTVALFFYGTEK